MAILDQGHPVLSFDILLDSSLDILADAAYEDLLRVAASGQVGYGAASLSCCEYSRLKLRDDGGPKALRSPEHLSGLPNLTALGAPTSPGKLCDAFAMCRSPYIGFSIGRSRTLGTTIECYVMVGASGTAISSTDWGFVHQYCSLCL